jgi:hypothetical protein
LFVLSKRKEEYLGRENLCTMPWEWTAERALSSPRTIHIRSLLRRFQVSLPVHDAMGVHGGESLKQPTNNPHRLRLRQPFFLVENTLDIAPWRRRRRRRRRVFCME